MADFPLEIDGKNISSVMRQLAAPFLDEEVEWRVGQAKNGRANLFCYMDSRAVMNRLDRVVGPHNWQTAERALQLPGHDRPIPAFPVGLALRIRKEWVWKWDIAGYRAMKGGDVDLQEAKAGFSDGLKRAAVHWGMGRHLYDLGQTWVSLSSDRPQGVPKNRVVYHRGQFAVAPSVRQLQAHLLSVDDLVRGITDPMQRRYARVEMVRTKLGWDLPNAGDTRILDLIEAASAIPFKKDEGEGWDKAGSRSLTKLSPESLKVTSRRIVDWYEDNLVVDELKAYGQWRVANAPERQSPEQRPPDQHAGSGAQGATPWGEG